MPVAYSVNNDFSNGIRYTLSSANHNQVYHGTTILAPQKRLDEHICHANNDLLKKRCSSRFIIAAGGDIVMTWESFPCQSLEELEDEEARMIEADRDGCVNMNIPGAIRRAGGRVLYRKLPRRRAAAAAHMALPHVKQYRAAWQRTPEVKAKKAERIDCECGKTYTRSHKARHRQTKMHKKFQANSLSSVPSS